MNSLNLHYAASLLLLTLSDGERSGTNISLCDSISLNSLDFPGEKVGTSGSLRPESVHYITYIVKNISTIFVNAFWFHSFVKKKTTTTKNTIHADRCITQVDKSQSWKIGKNGHRLYHSD